MASQYTSDVANLADKNWLIARTKLLKARWTTWYAVQCSEEGLDPFIEETKQPLYKCMVQHGGVISTGKDSPAFKKHWSLFPGNHFGLGRHVPRHVNPPLTSVGHWWFEARSHSGFSGTQTMVMIHIFVHILDHVNIHIINCGSKPGQTSQVLMQGQAES